MSHPAPPDPITTVLSCTLFAAFVVLVLVWLCKRLVAFFTPHPPWYTALLNTEFPEIRPGRLLQIPRKKIALVIDEPLQQGLLLSSAGSSIRFDFSELVAVDLIEDNESISRTSRSSQAMGAVVGGALFGGVGAVVGAMTGARKTSSIVRNLQLRVILDRMNNPTHLIEFMPVTAPRQSILYKDAFKSTQEWYGALSVIIHRNTKTAQTTQHA